ncbi:hypothetical protein [[Mycoplasma] collis]|uniref:hypothetical protein n=1 Tax=[Mycoplasma] collis TaxID=2127 RepID=UPI00051B2BB9|nr:hypothetical protein [[Mycoplasma] collis]
MELILNNSIQNETTISQSYEIKNNNVKIIKNIPDKYIVFYNQFKDRIEYFKNIFSSINTEKEFNEKIQSLPINEQNEFIFLQKEGMKNLENISRFKRRTHTWHWQWAEMWVNLNKYETDKALNAFKIISDISSSVNDFTSELPEEEFKIFLALKGIGITTALLTNINVAQMEYLIKHSEFGTLAYAFKFGFIPFGWRSGITDGY